MGQLQGRMDEDSREVITVIALDGARLSAAKSAPDTRLRFDRLTVPSLSRETDEGTGVPPVAGGGFPSSDRRNRT